MYDQLLKETFLQMIDGNTSELAVIDELKQIYNQQSPAG